MSPQIKVRNHESFLNLNPGVITRKKCQGNLVPRVVEHVKETSEGNTPIHPIQRTRQRRNLQIEGLEEKNIKMIFKQDGGLTLRGHGETHGNQHLRPRQLSRNSTTIGAKVDFLAIFILDRTVAIFFLAQRCSFRLLEI